MPVHPECRYRAKPQKRPSLWSMRKRGQLMGALPSDAPGQTIRLLYIAQEGGILPPGQLSFSLKALLKRIYGELIQAAGHFFFQCRIHLIVQQQRVTKLSICVQPRTAVNGTPAPFAKPLN